MLWFQGSVRQPDHRLPREVGGDEAGLACDVGSKLLLSSSRLDEYQFLSIEYCQQPWYTKTILLPSIYIKDPRC
jgi:hypothetical protein